jgi:hypothetical protein
MNTSLLFSLNLSTINVKHKKIQLNTLTKKSRHRKEVLPILFNSATKKIICTANSTKIFKPYEFCYEVN